MRAWRWILALLLALYAVQNTLIAIYSTSLKFGWVKATGAMQRLVPLSDATSIAQLAAQWIAIVLFFTAALRLVRRKVAFNCYLAASILLSGNWLSFKLGGVYDRTFGPAEQEFDYVLLGVMAVFGAGIWMIERSKMRAARAWQISAR